MRKTKMFMKNITNNDQRMLTLLLINNEQFEANEAPLEYVSDNQKLK